MSIQSIEWKFDYVLSRKNIAENHNSERENVPNAIYCEAEDVFKADGLVIVDIAENQNFEFVQERLTTIIKAGIVLYGPQFLLNKSKNEERLKFINKYLGSMKARAMSISITNAKETVYNLYRTPDYVGGDITTRNKNCEKILVENNKIKE